MHDSGLPYDAMPVIDGGKTNNTPCPYLETQWVADTNGERMQGQGIDTRFETPACVFYSYAETPQLQVIVRHTNSIDESRQVVDWAAPIDSTEPAEDMEGWSGGRGQVSNPPGAVYAVAKDNVAVVVFTDQEQSVKAQLVAAETIRALGL